MSSTLTGPFGFGSADAPSVPNKVTITDAGPCKKKIAIEIPAESVASIVGSSMETALVDAELPGFRKGRAPRRLVEKRFGSAVRKQAKEQLVASAYSKAIEENKIRVLGDPVAPGIETLEIDPSKPLAFELEVEVPPTFDVPALDGIAVKRPTISVSEEMVQKELEKHRINEGRLESRSNPEPGDYLTGHGRMVGPDAKVHLDLHGAVIQIPTPDSGGRGMILGIMVENFAAQVGLPTPGQTATVKAKGPENHENEEVRGKDLTITFTVDRVDRIIKATDQELADKFGYPSVDKMLETVRGRMESKVKTDQQVVMRNQVARHLVKATKMDLPERLTAQQAARNLERRRLELMYRGVPAHKIEEHVADLRAASAKVAADDLKLFFILDAVAQKLDVKVTEQEVNGRIAMMAMERGERPDKFRQALIQNNQVSAVFQQVREHKTLDAVLEKAKIEEVAAEEYNKMVEEEMKTS